MIGAACSTCGRTFDSMKALGGHVSKRADCRLPASDARKRRLALRRERNHLAGVRPRASLPSRFWAKVDRRGPDECWEWRGVRIPSGYGQIWLNGAHRPATHIALELAGRSLAPGQLACHSCDNPPCVNPAHLFGGTVSDNAIDMVAKGRGRWHRPR